MKTLRFPLFLFFCLSTCIFAVQLPSALLNLDDYFSHHVLVVEKSTHKLHLYRNESGYPKLLKSVKIATGKKSGDKISIGDHRTPEGVYQLTEFITHRELVEKYGEAGEIYGVGAFVLNYPNPVDTYERKTGHGIWLHSTNDETRIELGLDSRGCVVTANNELIDVSRYIELNRTSVVIVHNLNFISEEAWNLERKRILGTLESWLDAWRSKERAAYFSHYHPREFKDPIRGNFSQFKRYKTSVFSLPGLPSINISDLSVLRTERYAVVSFRQHYESRSINDVGKKLLYMKKDEYYNWKIVAEVWTKVGIDRGKNTKVAFRPSQRFFETENPSQILEIKYPTQNN